MKKSKKYLISMLVICAILINFVLSVQATDSLNKNRDLIKATQNLLQSGWTQEEIDDLLDERAILAYKDSIGCYTSEKKYYRVTDEMVEEISEGICRMAVEANKANNNRDEYFENNVDYPSLNHRGYIQYKAVKNNNDATYTSVFAKYYHQQSLLQVSPSISFPISIGISISNSSYFKLMSPNPYLSFFI